MIPHSFSHVKKQYVEYEVLFREIIDDSYHTVRPPKQFFNFIANEIGNIT